MRIQIGLLLFPDLTQLDLTGPYEVFTKFLIEIESITAYSS